MWTLQALYHPFIRKEPRSNSLGRVWWIERKVLLMPSKTGLCFPEFPYWPLSFVHAGYDFNPETSSASDCQSKWLGYSSRLPARGKLWHRSGKWQISVCYSWSKHWAVLLHTSCGLGQISSKKSKLPLQIFFTILQKVGSHVGSFSSIASTLSSCSATLKILLFQKASP